MKHSSHLHGRGAVALACLLSLNVLAQAPNPPPREGGQPPPGGGRGFGGRGGGPGPQQGEMKLVKQFDKDGDKRLNTAERQAAREHLASEAAAGRGRRGPGGGFGRGPGGNQPAPQAGAKVSPSEVKNYPNAPLYDLGTLRTYFLDFESADWEKELSEFYNTDVDVPAKLTVDGKTYKDVGVHFRGASSYFTVGAGQKHSLNVAVDFADSNQALQGYNTLNLLNSHTDPTYLRTVLYTQAAREYIAAPKANYVRVVINGENWGVYVNAEQFNKNFVKEWFGSAKAARWKVPGSPRARGGLAYLGEDPASYKEIYEIKSKDDPKSWADLIKLCRVLNQTPLDQLENALKPILDVDGALKFLALENALINSDGYWVRTSDYNIAQDEKGVFHLIPHDANETFRTAQGPGMGGGQGGVDLDPFAGSDSAEKPLLSRLLSVPALRQRYIGYVRDIAEKWLDWKKVGPLAEQYQALIADEVKADTRKLYAFSSFQKSVTEDTEEQTQRGPRPSMSLKSFVEQRQAFLLNHPEIKKAAK